MNTALKQPHIIGLDTASSQDQTAFTFICGSCGCTEQRQIPTIPEEWDIVVIDRGTGHPFIRCPDCNEKVERQHIADRKAAAAEPPQEPPARAFSVFLEKQTCGEYRIAMTPEAVLMRWLPLGFFLTSEQAHALADELRTFAMLAAAPGTLPTSMGEQA